MSDAVGLPTKNKMLDNKFDLTVTDLYKVLKLINESFINQEISVLISVFS